MNELFAFIAAIPVGMGLGGGGLLTIALTLTGEGQHLAQGCNLFCFLAAGGCSVWLRRHELRGKWAVIARLAGSALLTAIPAALLAQSISGDLLKKLFGGYMALIGIASLIKALQGKKEEKNDP